MIRCLRLAGANKTLRARGPIAALMILMSGAVLAQVGPGPFGPFQPGQPGQPGQMGMPGQPGMMPGPWMMPPGSALPGQHSPEIGKRLGQIMVLQALVGAGFGAQETANALPPLRALLKAEQELKERSLKILDAEKARLLASVNPGQGEQPLHEQLRAENEKFGQVHQRTWDALAQAIGPQRTELLRRLLGQGTEMMGMPGRPGGQQAFPRPGPGFPGPAGGGPGLPLEEPGDTLEAPRPPDPNEPQPGPEAQLRPTQPRRPGQPGAQPQRPGVPGQPGFAQPGMPGQPGFGQPGQVPMPFMMGPQISLEDLVALLEARRAALSK